jgi:hypothetical protein
MNFFERILELLTSDARIIETHGGISNTDCSPEEIEIIYTSLNHISYSEFTNINPIKEQSHFTNQTIYSAAHNRPWRGVESVMLLSFGSRDKSTLEFARIYSLPTHSYENPPGIDHFKRYSTWLKDRNKLIKGVTTCNDQHYLVVKQKFYEYYSLYGFCSACGILRCSPIWCICGHRELSFDWTSNNANLDEFIRESQNRTKSANEAYLEWIPFESVTINSSDDSSDTLYSGKCIINQSHTQHPNAWPINKKNLDKSTDLESIPFHLSKTHSSNTRHGTYLDQHTLTNDDDENHQRLSNPEFVNGISTRCDLELIPIEIWNEADDSHYQMVSL